MKIRETFTLLLLSFLLTSPLAINAMVNEESVFEEARYPASVLDLTLLEIQKNWWIEFVNFQSEETKRKHPLITQVGMEMRLRYSSWRDRISATGVIRDLNGFLKLSAGQRKQLVLNTLKHLKSSLVLNLTVVNKKTGIPLPGKKRYLETRHIELSFIINDLIENDRNEDIRLDLPLLYGPVGQAGYTDEQFVFSEPYYLNLKVDNGVAVSGDPKKFIIVEEE